MITLFIDTSTNYLYSAIMKNEEIINEVSKEYCQKLSEMALPEIAELIEESGVVPAEIDRIVVVNGPGSFTGIRIGITIAKVYAWSLNIPISTITSLEAMAVSNDSSIKIPMIDARRKYYYAAIYDSDNNELLKPQHIYIDELNEQIAKYNNYTIISNDNIKDYNETESYKPDFKKIIEYALKKETTNPHAVNPEYLKLTEAEKNLL